MTRILFIDDDPSFAAEMKFLLQENGFEVVTANDGDLALRILKEQKFDLVITDLLLIKTHGMEVILHMREFYPKVKIITISGGGWASSHLHLEAARLIGSDSCLAKPFQVSELISEIERVIA